MKRTMLIFLSSTFLYACGGGEGDGETGTGSTNNTNAEASAVPAVTESVSVNTPEASVSVSTRTMSELTVPDGFNYDQNSNLVYNIDISGYSTDNAYISVYTDYTTESDGSFTPHFNSRVAASSLSNGQTTLEFSVSSGIDTLLAEVQFYNGSAPLQNELSTNDSVWTF